MVSKNTHNVMENKNNLNYLYYENNRKTILRIPFKSAQHQVGQLYDYAIKSSDQWC